jgi:hypothetical protein
MGSTGGHLTAYPVDLTPVHKQNRFTLLSNMAAVYQPTFIGYWTLKLRLFF